MREKILRPFFFNKAFKSYAEAMGSAPADTKTVWRDRLRLYGEAPGSEEGGADGPRAGHLEGDTPQEDEGERREARGTGAGEGEGAGGAFGQGPGGRGAMTRYGAAAPDQPRGGGAGPGPARKAGAVVPGEGKGVPRSLGVAQCGGCGRKSFWRGDGAKLSPCGQGCGTTFYCSKSCALLDWELHRAECRFQSRGIKPTRAAEERWVTNASLARARRLLRRRHLPPEEVYAKYLEWREGEVAGEREAERLLRDDAWGLPDSDRPCCRPDLVGRVKDPNVASRASVGGRVITTSAGSRVLSARLDSRGRVVDRNYGAARGAVPGLQF